MTHAAPARRRRLGAALGALVAAAAAVLTAPGTASAGVTYTPPFELRNTATGKCLEVADWRTDVGAPVRQWTCTGGANQQWIVNNGSFVLNQHSSLCLDIPGRSTAWGVQLIQYTCSSMGYPPNQRWHVPGVSQPSTGPVTSFLETVLDVYGFDPSDGAPVVTWGANGGDNQTWAGLVPRFSMPPF
ncbi:RICIN domain-containing protein [Kitasatospora sp. NPDC059463]|uniref:RICIN domain-containing protein n=1 Tax=unclassified Kitasatospora TaxID=2633591 RepID=UPI0036A5C84A